MRSAVHITTSKVKFANLEAYIKLVHEGYNTVTNVIIDLTRVLVLDLTWLPNCDL